MPRTRSQEDEEDVVSELASSVTMHYQKPNVSGKFLTNRVWELHKSAKQTLECVICLERIACKNCFCLTACGHNYHWNCYMSQEVIECCVCRPSQV